MKHNLYDYDRVALGDLLASWGYSAYYANLIWEALYRQRVQQLAQIPGLPARLQEQLAQDVELARPVPILSQTSRDGTRKYLLQLADGESIEAVLMPYRDRYTACISTQAGCAMGCVFCATGQMGFTRNLTPGEIVGQILFLQAQIVPGSGRQLRNIVFMGMGEPLHNYRATMTALDILTDDKGLAVAARHITISTVGLVPAIRRLADEKRPVHLAVSLHGATDEERNRLVPLGRRWSLAELMKACRYYVTQTGRRIFFEWTLIAGENDTPEQAHALSQLLHGLDAHVNLIPLNPTADFGGTPSQSAAVQQFQQILREHGLPSTVRQRRGIDIDAGCGQLRDRATA